MRWAMLGTLACVGLVIAAIGVAEQRGEGGFAQRPAAGIPTATSGTELIVASLPLGEKGQLLTVVDPRQRALSVYHIDALSGKIALKSVRNIQWDLRITDFNNEKPLPQEIQQSLDQR